MAITILIYELDYLDYSVTYGLFLNLFKNDIFTKFYEQYAKARLSIRAIRFRNFSSAWFSDLSVEAGLRSACAERILSDPLLS